MQKQDLAPDRFHIAENGLDGRLGGFINPVAAALPEPSEARATSCPQSAARLHERRQIIQGALKQGMRFSVFVGRD